MNRWLLTTLISFLGWAAQSSELDFNFSQYRKGELPEGFRSTSSMSDTPGKWEIVLDEAPSELEPLTPLAESKYRQPVLAQTSENPTDEHFPMLIYDEEEFQDFTLETRFKIVAGDVDRMGGIAFRIQDVNNYYVIRASAFDNTLRFYKVVNGLRGRLIGPSMDIPTGEWLKLKIQCRGNKIDCWFNDKEAMPTITDLSFSSGKIGFYTKSDSVCHYADLKIEYEAKETLGVSMVKATMRKFSRLQGLELYGVSEENPEIHLVASHDGKEIGKPGSEVVTHVFKEGVRYFGKNDHGTVCTVPLQDRNGEPIAAARIYMETFPGQTRNNALARTVPIVKFMEAMIGASNSLTKK